MKQDPIHVAGHIHYNRRIGEPDVPAAGGDVDVYVLSLEQQEDYVGCLKRSAENGSETYERIEHCLTSSPPPPVH
jgi:hypothetical protein